MSTRNRPSCRPSRRSREGPRRRRRERRLIPEGIAWDERGQRFLIGSLAQHKIVVVQHCHVRPLSPRDTYVERAGPSPAFDKDQAGSVSQVRGQVAHQCLQGPLSLGRDAVGEQQHLEVLVLLPDEAKQRVG